MRNEKAVRYARNYGAGEVNVGLLSGEYPTPELPEWSPPQGCACSLEMLNNRGCTCHREGK